MHLGEHDQDMIIDQDEEEERNSEHFELFGLISVWPESSKSKFERKNKISIIFPKPAKKLKRGWRYHPLRHFFIKEMGILWS